MRTSRVAGYLKASGHECAHVNDLGLTSTDDALILKRARDEDLVLVTADQDFVQMLFASGDTRPSVVLMNRPGFRAYFLTWEGCHVHACQV